MQIIENEDVQGFRKPVVVNDWGSLGVYFRAKKCDSGTWSHSTQDSCDRIKAGDSIAVLWPDGSREVHRVVEIKETTRIGDMGRYDDVTSGVPHIVANLHGHPVRIPVEELLVRRV